MSESEARASRVLRLAEEFIERHRCGESPSLSEYIDRHPDLADRIREVFPAMAMMEDIALADESLATGNRVEAPGTTGTAPAVLGRLGDYRIIREAGRGGMGVVYEAEQVSLGRHVALKVLSHRGDAGSIPLQRFLFEARAAARLHHTNIVPVYGVGDQDGVHYYAMQFIQGQGLDRVFAELRANAEDSTTIHLVGSATMSLLTGQDVPSAHPEGPATSPGGADAPIAEADSRPPATADQARQRTAYYRSVARVGRDVADALAYAHSQGILHRDIKPSNLLLDVDGTVWITDFGLATGAGADALTETGSLVGTLRYMAPERFEGWSDPRSDVYALGATLYELLTLRPIFDDPNRARLMKLVAHQAPVPPRQVDPAIPLDLETIVLKATAKEPGHRYASAEAMAEDLRRHLEGRPILARRIGLVERGWRWSRRNPTLAGSLAALFLILSVASTGMTVLWRQAEGQRRRAEAQRIRADGLLELSDRRRKDAEASRSEAERLRAEAEANFAKARAAVDELLTRVSESQLLNVPGLQPLRSELLRSALTYYEDFVRQRADDPTLKAGLAAAQLRLAVIQRELGAEAQSEETLRKAMALHEAALRDRPDDPRLRAGMARCCAQLGTLGLDPVRPRMAPDQARPLLERAIGLWDGLVRAEPDQLDYLVEKANAYNLLAVLHSHTGRMPECLQALQTSIALRERLASAHPDDPALQNDLAASLNNLGSLVQRNSVERLDLLRIFRRSAVHGRVAHARAPQVVRYGRFLTVTLRNLGVTERSYGHFDAAIAAFRETLEVSSRLSRDNPALPGLRREFVQDARSLGDMLREDGRMVEAVRYYRESWEASEAVTRVSADDWYATAGLLARCARPAVDDGTSPGESERAECRWFADASMAAIRRAIAAGYKNAQAFRVGDDFAALRGRDDFPALLTRAESAARGQPLPDELSLAPFPPPGFKPADPIGQAPGYSPGHAAAIDIDASDSTGPLQLAEEQASSQHAIGLVQTELGQFEAAGATLGRALAVRESLVRDHPDDARSRAALAATRAAIGRLHWRSGKLADAVRAWDDVRQGLESDLEAHPHEAAIAEQLAAIETTVGYSYAEAALWEEAAESLRRAVQHGSRDRLAALSRANLMAVTGDREGLKVLCARILDEYGRTTDASFANRMVLWCALAPDAVPDPRRLVELAEKAVADGTPDPQLRFNLALANVRAGRFDEAVRLAKESLASLPPGDPGVLGGLIEAVLAIAHHRLGQPGEAARRLDALIKLDWDAIERWPEPEDWWRRADFLTLRREAIATVTGQPAPDDLQLRRRRGRAYTQLGQPARAEAEFRAAGGR
jgi:eukaryotic-like serine/threonine-protein kinase